MIKLLAFVNLIFLLFFVYAFTPSNALVDCQDGQIVVYRSGSFSDHLKCEDVPTSGDVPSGSILLLNSGSCPTGYTEQSSLNGKTLVGTLAANGNVGGTGGNDNITPAGTNSTVSFTPSGTNSAPSFTGNSGTIPAETISWPAGVPTHSGTAATFTGNAVVAASTNSGTKLVTGNTSTGVSPVTTATGSITITNQGTIAWPAGVPTNSTVSFTPTGSVAAPTFTGSSGTVSAQTFTGTQFDNRSAFVRVIFCKKD